MKGNALTFTGDDTGKGRRGQKGEEKWLPN